MTSCFHTLERTLLQSAFAIVVDQLMAALSRQDIDVPVIENSSLIVFEEAAYHAAIKRSMELEEME